LKCVVILGRKIYGEGVALVFASFGIGVGLAFLRVAANSGRSFASSVPESAAGGLFSHEAPAATIAARRINQQIIFIRNRRVR
jgi:hypothetical protein